jgi:CelD/BcsL family acetyltransferase involved in cellulose biosynthesis
VLLLQIVAQIDLIFDILQKWQKLTKVEGQWRQFRPTIGATVFQHFEFTIAKQVDTTAKNKLIYA